MSVNPLIQPSIGSAPPLGLVPSNPTAADDNAAIARDAVSNGTVDQVGRAAAKAFMNPETASGTANEQEPGYVGPNGIAVPYMPSKGFGTAKVADH